jgi:RNA polymerase sigma factor (sigma-70 family)
MAPSSAPRPAPDDMVERMYRQHGHAVLRRARALLQHEDEAREIVQEVFMSVLDKPDQFGGRSAITTWLYSVTTHACLTRLRDRRNRQRLDAERAPDPVPPAPSDGETTAMLRQLLDRLPEDLAVVAVHHHLDGMTHQEIADQLGCSRRQVGYLLERIEALASRGGAP